MSTQKTLAELDEALHDLDGMLDQPIQIRALGGYALMHHGIRPESVLTEDIDTATASYPRSVQRAIRTVAERRGLAPDWLNNDLVYAPDGEATDEDVAYHDQLIEACYDKRKDVKFANIDMSVADVETLANSKGFACESSMPGRGGKDVRDMLAIAEHEGCDTFDALTRRFPLLQDLSLGAVRDAMGKAPKNLSPVTTASKTTPGMETEFGL